MTINNYIRKGADFDGMPVIIMNSQDQKEIEINLINLFGNVNRFAYLLGCILGENVSTVRMEKTDFSNLYELFLSNESDPITLYIDLENHHIVTRSNNQVKRFNCEGKISLKEYQNAMINNKTGQVQIVKMLFNEDETILSVQNDKDTLMIKSFFMPGTEKEEDMALPDFDMLEYYLMGYKLPITNSYGFYVDILTYLNFPLCKGHKVEIKINDAETFIVEANLQDGKVKYSLQNNQVTIINEQDKNYVNLDLFNDASPYEIFTAERNAHHIDRLIREKYNKK